MKPQARNEVLRAVLPALAGAVLMAVLWWAHKWAYHSAYPDMPNEDRGTIGIMAILPLLYKGDIWLVLTTWDQFLLWGPACAFFAVGPLVAFMFSRGKAAHIFSLALLFGAITHGYMNVVSFHTVIMDVDSPDALVRLALLAWPCVAWIFALSLGGAAVGIAVQRIARAVARRTVSRRRLGGA